MLCLFVCLLEAIMRELLRHDLQRAKVNWLRCKRPFYVMVVGSQGCTDAPLVEYSAKYYVVWPRFFCRRVGV